MKKYTRGKSKTGFQLIILILCVFLASSYPKPAKADIIDHLDWLISHAYTLVTDGLKMTIAAVGNIIQGIVAKIREMAEDARATFLADSATQDSVNQLDATAAANADISPEDDTCQTSKLFYVKHPIMDAANGMRMALNGKTSSVGKGKSGQERSFAAATENVCSSCNSNWCFLSGNDYGEISICGTTLSTTDTDYTNADEHLTSLIVPSQYPVPKTITVLPDQHISFKSAVATPNSPTKDEVRYVAAYMYCQHTSPELSSPAYNQSGKVGAATYANIDADRNNTTLRSDGQDACHKALSLRTSCPAASANSFKLVGASETCFDDQKTACHALKDSISAGGMGIDKINNREADTALANCDQDGLSELLYEKIKAYRCGSRAYRDHLWAKWGTQDGVDWEYARCDADVHEYEKARREEALELHNAATNMLNMRNAGSPSNPTEKSTQGSAGSGGP